MKKISRAKSIKKISRAKSIKKLSRTKNEWETKYQNQAINEKCVRQVIEGYALCFGRPPSFSRTEATHTSTEDASAFKHLQVASENKMCMTIKNYTNPKVQAKFFLVINCNFLS